MMKPIYITASAAAALVLAGCTTVREAVTEAVSVTQDATLTGAQVVGVPGDVDGTATAQLSISDELDSICYDVNDLKNVGAITSATINRGAMGVNGPVFVNLKQDETGDIKQCINRSEWLETSFENAPRAYYIQINTATGAIRGQFHSGPN